MGLPHKNFVFKCNLSEKDAQWVVKNNKSFWAQIFIHWCNYNYTAELSKEQELYEQYLWLNSAIKIKGKVMLNVTAIE